MPFSASQGAAGQTIVVLMVGSAVFLGAVGAMFLMSQSSMDDSGLREDPGHQAMATSLLDLMLHSPGFAHDGMDWVSGDAGPDGLARLGLRDAHGPHLNFSKFDNLRLAPFEANDADGYVNYPEARASLGLEEHDLDFHIRAYPNLRAVEKLLQEGHKDPNLKVTYVGHAVHGGAGDGVSAQSPVCGRSPVDDRVLRLGATLRNGGETGTVFTVLFDVPLPGEEPRFQDNTFLVPAGQQVEVHADLSATSGRSCADITGFTLEVYDASKRLKDIPLGPPVLQGSDVLTASQDLTLLASHAYIAADKATEFKYSGPAAQQDMQFRIREGTDPEGPVAFSKDFKVPQAAPQRKVDVPGGSLSPGQYTAYLKHVGSGITVAHKLLVVDAGASVPGYVPPGGATGWTWDDAARVEVGYLDTVILQSCPFRYDSDAASPLSPVPDWEARCASFKEGTGTLGDVFPDLRDPLRDELGSRLVNPDGTPRYDLVRTLVVGSNVDHQPMVHVRHQVATWVAGGGTLIVFGSEKSNTQWMQDIFHLGIHSSSGGLAVEDESHPSLRVPDELGYDAYDHRGKAWKFTGQAKEHFTNVVSSGAGEETVLGVSDPGAFGSGSVLVTSWFPYDLYDQGPGSSGLEGFKFVNNMVTMSYRALYLDYGPQLPSDVQVTPAVSVATIDHPELGQVPLSIVLYVFPRV